MFTNETETLAHNLQDRALKSFLRKLRNSVLKLCQMHDFFVSNGTGTFKLMISDI